MKYPVFLSCPNPYLESQKRFLKQFRKELKKSGLKPRTIGKTDYTMQPPLEGIRGPMMQTDDLVAVALRRHHVITGKSKDGTNRATSLDDQYFTSPFCQIEPAMAFQMGLPTLIFREKGVYGEGVLEV